MMNPYFDCDELYIYIYIYGVKSLIIVNLFVYKPHLIYLVVVET